MHALCGHITTGIFCSFLAILTYGQPRSCGFNDDMLRNNPAFMQQESATQQWLADHDTRIMTRSSVTIPVVFHVVYSGEAGNISDLQIASQVAVLNRDYQGQAENRGRIPPVFRASDTPADMRFCLATTDPDGNPATGITRTATMIEGIGGQVVSEGRIAVHYDAFGGKDAWDPQRYVNIWVADLNGLLGRATFPGMAPFPEEDGVVIDPAAVGSLGSAVTNAPYDRGHTLTHELGHYFNLLHLFNSAPGCADNDFVDDTPVQGRPYSGCPSHPQVSCDSEDMFMNFMALTDDRCIGFFTAGQVARMKAALMVHRPGLIAGDTPCGPVISGRTPLDSVHAFYAPGDDKIVMTTDQEYDQSMRYTVVAADGRLITASTWQIGATLVIDTAGWPSGIYALTLRNGEARKTVLLAVVR
ncbi:MAG: zinc metalloprotease [Saprospiraceae bacterium]|nr:zinc metalloprotease [Saprospiraceae bacterium]